MSDQEKSQDLVVGRGGGVAGLALRGPHRAEGGHAAAEPP